ncbi:hypothetical protein K7432_003422 [Basidiobolus ranarum]|uniref:Uncharacterized protein n=1 Tax=Basidiobolus ranarum TaxID=34480 RepID=A0ABR2W667_9FUNG
MIYTLLQTAPTFKAKGSNEPGKSVLRFKLADVVAEFTNAEVSFEKGTVYVTDKDLYFYSEKSQSGFTTNYSNIVLQTVSRQDRNGPCVYIQLSEDFTKMSEDTPETFCEIRLSPENLDFRMSFSLFSLGRILHRNNKTDKLIFLVDDLSLAIAECAPQPEEVYEKDVWKPEEINEAELLEAAKASREYLDSILIPAAKRN